MIARIKHTTTMTIFALCFCRSVRLAVSDLKNPAFGPAVSGEEPDDDGEGDGGALGAGGLAL